MLLEATHAQLCTLLADDRLAVQDEEVAFKAVQLWVGGQPTPLAEADLLSLLRPVRFATMAREFVQGTVRVWPPLQFVAGQGLLVQALFAVEPPKPRSCFKTPIVWKVYDLNMMMTEVAGGVRFRRSISDGWDCATGTEPLTAGRHSWVVTASKAALAWSIGVIDTTAAVKDGFARSGAQVWNPHPWFSGRHSGVGRNDEFKATWQSGQQIRVIVDMDERTLSFEVDGVDQGVAFRHLPPSVYPYISSGDGGDGWLTCTDD